MHALLLVLVVAIPASSQVMIDTFAGGRIRSGVPAQEEALSLVRGLTWDRDGNLVFSENRNLIRRVTATGLIETIAGNGTTGFSGDGGPAIEATLNYPASLKYSARGDLYFAELGNYRIRKIDTRGVITTVAGTGVRLADGMAVEGPALERSLGEVADLAIDPAGNVYFIDARDMVRRVTPNGRIEVFARPGSPSLIEFAGGDLYVVQSRPEGIIQRIAPDGTITPFAGYGPYPGAFYVDDEGKPAMEQFFDRAISGLSSDPAGNIYIVHEQGFARGAPGTRIRRIDRSGVVRTIAGPVRPTFSIAAGERGNVAFSEGSVLREVTPDSTLRTLAGGEPRPAADGAALRQSWFTGLRAMTFNRAGELLFAERCLIRKISGGVLTTVAGTGKCGISSPIQPNTTQDLTPPAAIAADSQGRLYVVDSFGYTYVVEPNGTIALAPFPLIIGGQPKLAIDARDRIYLMGSVNLIRISPNGTREDIVRPPSQPGVPPAGFGPTSLTAIGTDPTGNVYFTGRYLGDSNKYIFRVKDDGAVEQIYRGIINNELSLAVDSAGRVWLGGGVLKVASPAGVAEIGRREGGYSGDGGPAASARIDGSMVAVSPDGGVYVADGIRIRRLTGSGPAAAPSIAPGGIVNAASFTAGPIAKGELVAIFGSNFGPPGLQVNAPENGRVPTVLNQTKVYFDGFPGTIVAVTPDQINVFAPDFVQPGKTAEVIVQVDDRLSAPMLVPVALSAFGLATINQSGSGQGAILNQDGSINSTANPVARGSIVSLFGTGEGEVSPRLNWGELSISTPYSTPVQPVSVSIGGLPAEVQYAGAAPWLPIGVLQINARIPATVPSGNVTVSVTIGDASPSRQVIVAVK